jgi:branched-subunit amino acid ABC-type transport system permease component
VLVTSLAGIGDLLPAGSVPPEIKSFLQQWLPSGLASWRDAVVFIVLILVLLVRPQGILGRRSREDEL